jgi:hypothetical protein
MSEINIELVETTGLPMFRLTGPQGRTPQLLEIRVTEIGMDEPSWRAVLELADPGELVEAGIISEAEARSAGTVELRFQNASLLEETAIPVTEFQYGCVPAGMRQVGKAQDLKRGGLYEVIVSGIGSGALQFCA